MYSIKRWALVALFAILSFSEVGAQTYVRIGTPPYTSDFFEAANFPNGVRFSTEGVPGGTVTFPGITLPLRVVGKFAYMIPTELYEQLMRAPRDNRRSIINDNIAGIVNFNKNFAAGSENPFGCLFLNAIRCEIISGVQFSNNLDSSELNSFQKRIVINAAKGWLNSYSPGLMSNDISNILNQILIGVNRKSDALKEESKLNRDVRSGLLTPIGTGATNSGFNTPTSGGNSNNGGRGRSNGGPSSVPGSGGSSGGLFGMGITTPRQHP